MFNLKSLHIVQKCVHAFHRHGVIDRRAHAAGHAVSLDIQKADFSRAFDNLYANLAKYAEPSEPIVIQYRRMESTALLTLVNTVSSQRESRESTNIGLNTCRRIMRMLGGSFKAKEAEGVFIAEVRLPFSDNNCEETKK